MEIKHNFVSAKSDGGDTTQVQPSHWNAVHTITMTAPGLIGKSTAGAGAAIELSSVPISLGGTGQTTQQLAINALAGGVTANRLLRADGTNVVLAQVALTTDVTGILPVTNGGLNLSSIPSASVLVSNATNTVTTVAAGANQSIRRNSGNTAWEAYTPISGVSVTQLPIFSANAATATPISNSENLVYNRLFTHNLTNGNIMLNNYNNSLVLLASSTSQSNIATSADGETWTLRAMSIAGDWRLATAGSNVLAVATGTTTVNISTNGTSYSTATALPGISNSSASVNLAALNSTTYIVWNSATTAYLTTNHGTSWSTETLPATPANGFYIINGKFWFWSNSTTVWYSATGTTGSWTSATLPVAPSNIWEASGTVYFATTGIGAQIYKMDTESTYSAISGVLTTVSGGHAFPIEGVYACFNSTFGTTATWHANGSITRTSSVSVVATGKACVKLGSIYCLKLNGTTVVPTITAASSQTAYFG